MPRDEFVSILGDAAPSDTQPVETPPDEPLPSSPELFWKAGPIPEDLAGPIGGAAGAALPKRLGKFPFWRGRENFLDSLDAIYSSAAARTAGHISEG
jgi:hypothetical protein